MREVVLTRKRETLFYYSDKVVFDVLDGFRAIHQQKKQHLNIWWKQVSIRLPPREGDVTKEKLETFEKMVMQK